MAENERMAVVETRLEYLIGLVENHVSAGCQANDCKLNDRVVTCESDLKIYKRLTWGSFGTLVSCLTALIGKGVYEIWLK